SIHQEQDDYNTIKFDFQHEYFVCVAILIDRYDDFVKKYPVDRQYYLKMLIINISEQIINSHFKCIGVNMDMGEIGLIINVDSSQISNLNDVLRNCIKKIQSETAMIFDYTISIGVGRCYKGDAQIST